MHLIFNFINFVGLNLAVAISSFLIVLWLTRYKICSFSKLFLSLFIVFCSQIIIVEISLGVLSLLSCKNVSILIYLIFLGSILLLGKKSFRNFKIEKTERDHPGLFGILVLFSPIIFLLFVKAFNAALQIPLEYDSVAYHLPFVSKWLQTGTLNHLYYSAFAGPISYYPSNYELLDLWTFLPFRNDFFANLINFPLFIILGIVIWRILRNFGVGKNIALISTAIPFYMPIFLHQAGIPLVDLFFALIFTISIYFIQEISNNKEKDNNYSDFLLFGLSIGLFIGTKYLGLVYGAILVLLLTGIAFCQSRNRQIKLLKAGFVTLAGILLTGSFFYIRNWVDSGNPLFPIDVNFLGINIFEGYQGINENLKSTSLLENFHNKGRIKEFLKTFFYITGPYGIISILMPLIILPIITAKIILNYLKRITVENKEILIPFLLALGILLYFYLYIKAPYTNKDLSQNIRYSMPFLLMGTFGLAYIVSKVKFFKLSFYFTASVIFIFSLILLIVNPPEFILYGDKLLIDYSILWKYKEYLLVAIIGLIALFYSLQFIFSKFKNNKLKIATVGLSLVFSFIISFQFIGFSYSEREILSSYWSNFWFSGDQTIFNLIQASEWFNKNVPEAKIAYSGFNFHYHLYGRDLLREVDYVNINECTDCQYVDYKNSENSIRRDPNYQNWLENLKKLGKEYLIVNPLSTEDVRSYEFEWANENPNNFKKMFNMNDVYIYRISYD